MPCAAGDLNWKEGQVSMAQLGLVFLGSVGAAAIGGFILWPIAVGYLVLSGLTYGVYGWDKRAAKNGRWRTPEKTLHLLSLAGGWPGALVGQRQFRHKTSKTSFQVIFWLTVVGNIAMLAGFVAEGLK